MAPNPYPRTFEACALRSRSWADSGHAPSETDCLDSSGSHVDPNFLAGGHRTGAAFDIDQSGDVVGEISRFKRKYPVLWPPDSAPVRLPSLGFSAYATKVARTSTPVGRRFVIWVAGVQHTSTSTIPALWRIDARSKRGGKTSILRVTRW